MATNDTGHDIVIPSMQNDDGTTLVIPPGAELPRQHRAQPIGEPEDPADYVPTAVPVPDRAPAEKKATKKVKATK